MQLWIEFAHLFNERIATHLFHVQVGQQNIRFYILKRFQRFGCARGHADKMNVGFALQHSLETHPHNMMVVDDERSNSLRVVHPHPSSTLHCSANAHWPTGSVAAKKHPKEPFRGVLRVRKRIKSVDRKSTR